MRKEASHQNIPKGISKEWNCGCFLSFLLFLFPSSFLFLGFF